MEALAFGRLDLGYSNGVAGWAIIRAGERDPAGFGFAQTPVRPYDYYPPNSAATAERYPALMPLLDQAIAGMVADGTVDRILKAHSAAE